MPTHAEIIAEMQLLTDFLTRYFATATHDDHKRDYDSFSDPRHIHFTIWLDGGRAESTVINNLKVDKAWQGNGLGSHLFHQLESAEGMVDVSVRCAKTTAIKALLTKRKYEALSGEDYVKIIDLKKSSHAAETDRRPGILAWIKTLFHGGRSA